MSAPDQVSTQSPNVTVIVSANTNTCPVVTPSPSATKPKSYYRLTRILRKPKSTVKPHPWRREKQMCNQEGNDMKTGQMPQQDQQLLQKKPQQVVQQEDEDKIGFSLTRMHQLINSLTPAQKQRARAGLAPLSQTQEALAQRAARFGLSFNPPIQENTKPSGSEEASHPRKLARVETATAISTVAVPLDLSDETLQRREARFKTPEQVEMELQMQRRAQRFGTTSSTTNNECTSFTVDETSNQAQTNGVTSSSSNKPSAEIKLSDADRAAMQARAKRFGM